MEIEEAKRRAKAGPAILLLRRFFALSINFLTTITVARIVSPREYGLAAMATVLLSLGQMFRDFGLTNAVLRKGTVSHEEMSLIFWFNCIMTLTVAGVIAAISPLASSFYNEPIVKWVILLSLVGFIIDGFSLQHRALINRELRFGTIATIDAVSLLTGFVTTLALALAWRNVWAIVVGTMAQVVTGSVLNVVLSGFRPGRLQRSSEAKSLLKFGANTSVYSIGTFFSQNAATILIGHFLGSAMLGQYNRAWALYQLPSINLIQPLTQAAMPLLTRLRSHDDEYRAAYVGLVRKLCAFLMPVSIALMFAAVPLVHTLLGPQWHEAGLVLAALSPALIGTGLGYSAGDLFVTQDRSAELRTLGLYDVGLRVSGVAIGLQFGLAATALGFSLSTLIAAAIRIYVAGRTGPVSRLDQLRAALPGLVMAIGTAVACGVSATVLDQMSMSDATRAICLLSAGAVGALIIGLSFALSRQALAELADSFGVTNIYRKTLRKR